jgi:hypothetical protein
MLFYVPIVIKINDVIKNKSRSKINTEYQQKINTFNIFNLSLQF